MYDLPLSRFILKKNLTTIRSTNLYFQVLRNMPIICQRRERESDVCQLVACVSQEICKMVIDDKQIQIIANFLFMITEVSVFTEIVSVGEMIETSVNTVML